MRKPKAAPKEAVQSVRIPLRIKRKIEQEALRYRVSQNSIIIDALRDRMEPERRGRGGELVVAGRARAGR